MVLGVDQMNLVLGVFLGLLVGYFANQFYTRQEYYLFSKRANTMSDFVGEGIKIYKAKGAVGIVVTGNSKEFYFYHTGLGLPEALNLAKAVVKDLEGQSK